LIQVYFIFYIVKLKFHSFNLVSGVLWNYWIES